MKINIAISPCPNDIFIFEALLSHKIKTGKYDFNFIIKDVEELNKMAFNAESDVTKLSFHTLFKVYDNYKLLNTGAALGNNCGPLLISRRKIYLDELSDCRIAIPGKNTTANLLMNIFYPQALKKQDYLFSDIEDVVLSNECDVGLVIHETRFTYHQRGLRKIADLGEMWESKHQLPLPLGGIAIKKEYDYTTISEIEELIRHSLEYANSTPMGTIKTIKQYSKELSEEVILQHINLYVNDFTINLGEKGNEAVNQLYSEYLKYQEL